MKSALFALLVDALVESTESVPTRSSAAASNSAGLAAQTMDRAAYGAVQYHGGWCVVAARKNLMTNWWFKISDKLNTQVWQ